jgi:hypothetical protein
MIPHQPSTSDLAILFLQIVASLILLEGCWAFWFRKELPLGSRLLAGRGYRNQPMTRKTQILGGLAFALLSAICIYGVIHWFELYSVG